MSAAINNAMQITPLENNFGALVRGLDNRNMTPEFE